MGILEALFLGALQGVTEFIPVSSSGHLRILKELLGFGEVSILFDVLLHIATLLVTLLVFRNRVFRILRALWIGGFQRKNLGTEERKHIKTAGIILVATFVTGIIGILLKDFTEGFPIRFVSILFLVTAGILIVPKFLPQGNRGYGEISWKDGVILGFAQGIGVLPGISRSGITIATGLSQKLDRETAGELSFIISLPAMLGALILTLRDADTLSATVSPPALAAGFLASMVVGFFSLLLLIRFIKSGKLHYFAAYLLPLGILGLIVF